MQTLSPFPLWGLTSPGPLLIRGLGIWVPSLYFPLNPGAHPPAPSLTGAPMAGSEELGLREDTLRVLAAFLSRGEAAGSPIPTPPR